MRKAGFIAGLLLIFVLQSSAQKPYSISGVIEDTVGAVLANATVRLVKERDTFSILTKQDGRYNFTVEQTGPFDMKVTMKGYVSYHKWIVADSKGAALRLRPIVLQADYRELDPVIISKVRPFTILKDTIAYNAAAFRVHEGDEVEELLKRLPGIEVDMDGNVIVLGKKISKAMIDGKLLFGGDVLTAIRNLPADIVNKLEVIDDYGDEARLTGIRSGQPGKILNIVLKQDKKNGLFGHVQTGAGSPGKYTADANANSFNGERQISISGGIENNNLAGNDLQSRVALSYANRPDQKWKVETNGILSVENPHSSSSMVQDIYFAGGTSHQEQTSQSSGNNKNDNFGAVLSYTPNRFQTFRISSSLSLQRTEQLTLAHPVTVEEDSGFLKKISGYSINQSKTKDYSGGTDFYFEQLSTHSKSRFNGEVSMRYSGHEQQLSNQLNMLVETSDQQALDLQHYIINNVNPSGDIGASVNYFSPLGGLGFMEFGYNLHSGFINNDKITWSEDSLHSNPNLIDSLSQNYVYHTLTQRVHTEYSTRLQQLNITVGLNLQSDHLRALSVDKGSLTDHYYFNLAPAVQASYGISKNQVLTLHYNGASSLPSFQQIQPIADLTNPQYPVIGNPTLKPAYTHSANLHYERSTLKPGQFYGFGINIGYVITENSIIQNISHVKDSSAVIQRTSYINVDGFHSFNGEAHLTLPAMFHRRVKITLNNTANFGQGVLMTDGVKYLTSSLNSNQSMHIQVIIPDVIETDISGNYSITHMWYPDNNGPSTTFSSVGWSLNNKHYLFKHWIMSYQTTQLLTGSAGHGLQPNPILITASTQWQFLRGNRAAFRFIVYNLLDNSTGTSQNITPTSVTRIESNLTGRYFIFSLSLKFGRFK